MRTISNKQRGGRCCCDPPCPIHDRRLVLFVEHSRGDDEQPSHHNSPDKSSAANDVVFRPQRALMDVLLPAAPPRHKHHPSVLLVRVIRPSPSGLSPPLEPGRQGRGPAATMLDNSAPRAWCCAGRPPAEATAAALISSPPLRPKRFPRLVHLVAERPRAPPRAAVHFHLLLPRARRVRVRVFSEAVPALR